MRGFKLKDIISIEYKDWLCELKSQIKRTQIKASISVNSQLIMLYWDLGRQICEKQETAKWGSGFIEQLSRDLKAEFPEMSGFYARNLLYCKQFYKFYTIQLTTKQPIPIVPQVEAQLQLPANKEDGILPQVEAKLDYNKMTLIPWGHHKMILDKCDNIPEAIFYINKTIENNWSRAVLEYQIETDLYKRQGKSTTNFKLTLPEPESDLANEIMKDEYCFDFLHLSDKVKEIDLEKALIQHMTQFLTELGKGFAYMGRQYPIRVGQTDLRIDLLFYHTKLRCYIVIELKVKKFEAGYLGNLLLYINAADKLIKDPRDNPTIGIMLCKDKDDVLVDFALDGINRPIGVGTYKYTELTEEEVKNALPTIEELKEELMRFDI